MPLARGIMQMGRINVYPTTTTLVSISPSGSAHCGDTISFTVHVANNRGVGFPIPTGTVYIIDGNNPTNPPVASGTLSGGNVVINTGLSNGSINPVALYVGVVNQFGGSQSDPAGLYSVSIIDTTVNVTNTPGDYFCFSQPYNLGAHVVPNSGVAIPTGRVQFNLYTDAVTFTTIGFATLDGSGNALLSMPGGTTVPGNNYYIQALYEGGGCFGPSNSPLGTSGTLIHAIDLTQNTTTTTAGIASGSTFCIHSGKTFTATVSSAHLGGPNVGSVTWTATKSPTTITLGTDSTVTGGAASINVSGDVFPSTGTWTVTATYTGDGACYADSTSAGLSVFPSTFGISMSYSSGSTFFCYATAQSYSYFVSSTFSGTINGTFVLKSSFGNTLATVTTSGSSGGFYVTFNVPAFTFSDGSQNIFVQFTPAGGSCYSATNSGNTGVNVKSFLNQSPSSVSLGVSPSSGYTYTTFTFNITVFKGSGTGPLDGAGSLNGSATLYVNYQDSGGWHSVNNNIHIYDFGSYGSGSYMGSGFSASNALFSARWNGNLCYNYMDSPNVAVSINYPPPH